MSSLTDLGAEKNALCKTVRTDALETMYSEDMGCLLPEKLSVFALAVPPPPNKSGANAEELKPDELSQILGHLGKMVFATDSGDDDVDLPQVVRRGRDGGAGQGGAGTGGRAGGQREEGLDVEDIGGRYKALPRWEGRESG